MQESENLVIPEYQSTKYKVKKPVHFWKTAERSYKSIPACKNLPYALKHNMKTDNIQKNTSLYGQEKNVSGCQTLRQFLKSVKYTLKKELIPYHTLMRSDVKQSPALTSAFQSLLLQVYRSLIVMHIKRIELTSNQEADKKGCLRLRGGGKSKNNKGPKIFASKNNSLNSLLNILRNCSAFRTCKSHKKCEVSSCCLFCLLRSTVYKINSIKGRHSIIPIEVELNISTMQVPEYELELLKIILQQAYECNQDFERTMSANLTCSNCASSLIDKKDSVIMNIDSDTSDRSVQTLVDMKIKSLHQSHMLAPAPLDQMDHHCSGSRIQLAKSQKSILISSSSMDLNISKELVIGNDKLKIIAAISTDGSTYFSSNNVWYHSLDIRNEVYHGDRICASLALYEKSKYSTEENSDNENFVYSGQELIKIRDKKRNKLSDRHRDTEKRREDRHIVTEERKIHDRQDRHRATEERNQDRHRATEERQIHDNQDRHRTTEDRHRNTTARINYVKKYVQKAKVQDLWSDTGMDLICSSCIEWKSRNSCASIDKIPKAMVLKYCSESSITLNYDGKFYVCKPCKVSIVKDVQPKRCQKEILGLLSFPKTFYDGLEKVCVPFNKRMREDVDKKYLQLNRLEDFLLKPVIPFIRIAHLPRGRYVQLKGDLIMVSANIPESMTKILPVSQQLVPVALKRKLKYTGHFIYEYVDKVKLIQYFMFLKRHNHIFEKIELDLNLVENFEKKTMNYVEKVDTQRKTDVNTEDPKTIDINYSDIFDSDEDDLEEIDPQYRTGLTTNNQLKEDDIFNSDEEESTNDESLNQDEYFSRCASSSLIGNKYREDTNSYTVANQLSNSIISFERTYKQEGSKEVPHEDCHLEDEIYQSDDDNDIDNDRNKVETELLNLILTMKKMTKSAMNQLSNETIHSCKCQLEKNLALLIHYSFELEHIHVESEKTIILKKTLKEDLKNCISKGKQSLKLYKSNCDHEYNKVMSDIENIMENNAVHSTQFIEQQMKLIKERVAKVCVAPSETGEWKNWHSDVFLEEKLFPNLYPYGFGGYLSSNLLNASDMGISNYIKSRILSADPKFRNDTTFVFFWLLVKELTDIKRSEQTFLRKSSKAPNLTANTINEIGKENLIRFNTAYNAYKNLRGTSMYYQDKKKELMATLRQKGAPTLFMTFSCAEFEWDHLIQSIYKTVYKKDITIDEVQKLPHSLKNKLVGENVVQSTTHFSKRTNKLMSLMKTGGVFVHNGVDFKADSYFYRVEFQARGAPHIHCLIWLKDDDGVSPPSLWNECKETSKSLCQSISSFGNSIMSGTADDMHCDDHETLDDSCIECNAGKNLVYKFQSHKHGFSCKKKGKKLESWQVKVMVDSTTKKYLKNCYWMFVD